MTDQIPQEELQKAADEAEQSMMDYPDSKEQPLWIQIARWIALIPGAIAAKVIVTFGGLLVLKIFTSVLFAFDEPDDHGLASEIIWPTVITAFSCYSFMYCGMWIAPKHKKSVGYVLSGFLIASVFFIFLILLGADRHSWRSGLDILGSLIGTGVMIYFLVTESDALNNLC